MAIKIFNKIFVGILIGLPIALTLFSSYLFISTGTTVFTAYSLQQWYPYRNIAFAIHAAILAIDLLFLKNFRSKEINAFRGIWMGSLLMSFFSHELGRMLLGIYFLISSIFPH